MIKTLLLVAAGGAIGSVGRHLFNQMSSRFIGTDFPWGTLGVNIIGSLLIGIIVGLLAFSSQWSQDIRSFVVVGILGGFTTFSAFSLDVVLLGQRGAYSEMLFYIGGSVFLSLAAAIGGLYLARVLFS